jgi:hypothetical protein
VEGEVSCEHVQLKDGSVAIVCGLRRGKRTRCQFCEAPGTKLCDWKCDKPTKIGHGELQPEDTVVTQQKGYRLKVAGFQRFLGDFRQRVRNGKGEINSDLSQPGALVRYPVTMYGLVFPDGKCWLYYLVGDAKLTVLRPGTCDTPCCERHSRAAGEEIDYCMDHWRAWEEVA